MYVSVWNGEWVGKLPLSQRRNGFSFWYHHSHTLRDSCTRSLTLTYINARSNISESNTFTKPKTTALLSDGISCSHCSYETHIHNVFWHPAPSVCRYTFYVQQSQTLAPTAIRPHVHIYYFVCLLICALFSLYSLLMSSLIVLLLCCCYYFNESHLFWIHNLAYCLISVLGWCCCCNWCYDTGIFVFHTCKCQCVVRIDNPVNLKFRFEYWQILFHCDRNHNQVYLVYFSLENSIENSWLRSIFK